MSRKISFWQKWATKHASGVVVAVVRAWMRTLNYRVVYHDRSADPISPECRKPHLYLFWHEYILFPLYVREHSYLTMLLSAHRDADILSEVATRMGFYFVRGSTRRGGDRAIRALFAAGRSRHLAITPDGPRGPRRTMAPGAIYLASRLGTPIVAIGFGYDRPWRMNSWDRFAIPRPFSRARAIVSRPIVVPPDLSREGIEEYRTKIQNLLNELTAQAEDWATSGATRADEERVVKAPASLPLHLLPQRIPQIDHVTDGLLLDDNPTLTQLKRATRLAG